MNTITVWLEAKVFVQLFNQSARKNFAQYNCAVLSIGKPHAAVFVLSYHQTDTRILQRIIIITIPFLLIK